MSDQRLIELVELVRRIRHDANNPLTAALGHVQLLLDDPAPDHGEIRTSLQIVESELKRLIQVLRRLNDVRVEASNSPG
jgi:signal transduction histidine kinase